ncbi:VanW family protein [Nakamurella lactea]|uniref:VanW family protein n=1 Tax=Nakamurella lactea TaxID=459515 RepID=UPI00041713B0|nr:VanW family protein [Nakamurella lactea]
MASDDRYFSDPAAVPPGETAPASGAADRPGADGGRSGRRKGLISALAAAGVFAVLLIGYLIDLGVTRGEIERGTEIAGVDVGGLTPEQARKKLDEQLGSRFAAPVAMTVHGTAVTVSPAEAGLTADLDAAVAAAGTSSASPIARLTSFFRSEQIPLATAVDRSALTQWLSSVATSTDIAAVEGSVSKKGTKIAVVAPVTGLHLEVDAAATAVAVAWADGGPDAVTELALPVTEQPVRASAAGVAAAKQKAGTMLSAPVAVDAAGTDAKLSVAQIAAAMSIKPDAEDGFSVTVDVARLRVPVTDAVEATQTEPKDAVIALVDGKPQLTEAITGRKVDWPASERALTAVLAQKDGRTWQIAYTTSDPDFTTARAKALGIKEVIGEFTTGNFVWASGQNIKTAAAKINGVVVQPGGTFSLNDATKPRDAAHGYIESGIIQNGKADKALGGGVSQLSTTLYNAAFFAGMRDVEHKAHSYYISRYPEGREATIFDDVIDMVWANDYPTGVLVQTIWTENDITVRLWGTKQVEVESQTGERYNFTNPPQTTVPYGQSCNPSDGSSGFSVDVTRIIRDLAGKEIKRETKTTVYNGQYQVICEPAPAPPPTTAPPATTPPATAPPATKPPAQTQPPGQTPPPVTKVPGPSLPAPPPQN